MAKLITTDVSNFQNETAAANIINNNFAAVETAVEKTLSRDGTSPNQMGADLDMNSNRILNLMDAVSDQEPVTYSQFQDSITDLQAGTAITAPYVTMASSSSLTAERVLTAGTGISITDGGPNSIVTIAATGSTTAAPKDAAYVTLSTNATLDNERVLTAGAGLTGTDGGAGSNITLAVGAGTGITVNADDVQLATIVDQRLLANTSGGTAAPIATSTSALLDATLSNTQGAILYRGSSSWAALSPGTSGQLLKTNGAAANPSWVTAAGTGDMLAANNLSDVANAATSFANIKQLATTSATGVIPYPYNCLYGLDCSNSGVDATNDIVIAIGCADAADHSSVMHLSSAITKQLDASWAVGTNAGGLDTGSIANAFYYVWLIQRSDTGVVDVLFSTSATAPTMPSSYDRKRRIGAFKRASAAILPFNQAGDLYLYKTSILDHGVVGTGTSRFTPTLSAPTGSRALFRASFNSAVGGFSFVIGPTYETNSAPVYNSPPGISGYGYTYGGAASNGFNVQEYEVLVDTSRQIAVRCGASDPECYIFTRGWKDTRGRS